MDANILPTEKKRKGNNPDDQQKRNSQAHHDTLWDASCKERRLKEWKHKKRSLQYYKWPRRFKNRILKIKVENITS